ncbi:hypothetical protein ACFQX7_23670 [Luedemannella flava]
MRCPANVTYGPKDSSVITMADPTTAVVAGDLRCHTASTTTSSSSIGPKYALASVALVVSFSAPGDVPIDSVETEM